MLWIASKASSFCPCFSLHQFSPCFAFIFPFFLHGFFYSFFLHVFISQTVLGSRLLLFSFCFPFSRVLSVGCASGAGLCSLAVLRRLFKVFSASCLLSCAATSSLLAIYLHHACSRFRPARSNAVTRSLGEPFITPNSYDCEEKNPYLLRMMFPSPSAVLAVVLRYGEGGGEFSQPAL